MRLKIVPLDLRPQDYLLLSAIQNGADIYGAIDANHLRNIDRRLPGIVKFSAPRRRLRHGNQPSPYFGVRCTPKGISLLRQYETDVLKLSAQA